MNVSRWLARLARPACRHDALRVVARLAWWPLDCVVSVYLAASLMPVLWRAAFIWGFDGGSSDDLVTFLEAHYPLELRRLRARMDRWDKLTGRSSKRWTKG